MTDLLRQIAVVLTPPMQVKRVGMLFAGKVTAEQRGPDGVELTIAAHNGRMSCAVVLTHAEARELRGRL